MNKTLFVILVFVTLNLTAQTPYDLCIKHASVFDTKSGKVVANQKICIRGHLIAKVTGDAEKVIAKKTIDATGKLVTPGFIDVHGHMTNALGDYAQAPSHVHKDSIPVYRMRHALTYLPYGITTVRDVGDPEQWISMILQWQKNPAPQYPDIYTSGAALVSKEENRKTYIGHAVVDNPAAAAAKVQSYYDRGIRDIKLYWRLRYPDLKAALDKATELHMHVSAHIDRGVTARDSVVKLGVRDLEHFHPYAIEYLTSAEMQQVDSARKYYREAKGGFLGWQMEVFRILGRNHPKMMRSIALLKEKGTSLTPTISIFGQAVGLSYMQEPVTIEEGGLNTEDFSAEQKQRCLEGYAIMMTYVKQLYDHGVQLNLGTDCPDGGKAALSELLLLHKTGIPLRSILQIATINGAKAIGRENLYGSVEQGKKADLIIFDKSPLEDAKYLLSKKIIVKDGTVYQEPGKK